MQDPRVLAKSLGSGVHVRSKSLGLTPKPDPRSLGLGVSKKIEKLIKPRKPEKKITKKTEP